METDGPLMEREPGKDDTESRPRSFAQHCRRCVAVVQVYSKHRSETVHRGDIMLVLCIMKVHGL